MSLNLHLRGPGATNPMPDASRHGNTPLDLNSYAPWSGATLSTEGWTTTGRGTDFLLGTSDPGHYGATRWGEGFMWMTPPFSTASGTLNGTWSLTVYALNNIPLTYARSYVYARAYHWLANDSFYANLLSETGVEITSTTVASYTINFGSASVTPALGDRIALEIYACLQDSSDESFGWDLNIRYGRTDKDSIFTVPGTPVFAMPVGCPMEVLGAGYRVQRRT